MYMWHGLRWTANFLIGKVSGALALYHLAPVLRAISRIRRGDFGYGQGLGGPWVHLIVHVVVFATLAQLWVRGKVEKEDGRKVE